MNNLELSKTVYKLLGISDSPILGWTIIGLLGAFLINIWASGWVQGIDTVKDWLEKNTALCSIFFLAVCIGIGSYRNLRKEIKAIKDQQEEIKTLCGDGDKDE